MRTRLRNAAFWGALAVLLGIPAMSVAQTQVDHTTFSTAVTATATSVILTANSSSAAGDYLYVEGEAMRLASNTSGTTWTVQRGRDNGATPARAHSTTAIVWTGAGQEYKDFNVAGTCTASNERFLPHINTKQNRIFDCSSSGRWNEREQETNGVQSAQMLYGGRPKVRDEFNQGYLVMQDDGTAKSLSDTEINFVYGSPLGGIEYREEQAKTTSSWVTVDGQLDVTADNTTASEGVEIIFAGGTTTAALNQVLESRTNGGCISAMITIGDVSGTNQVLIGWRQNEAYQDAAAYTGYTDWSTIGQTNVDGSINAQGEVNAGGTLTDDTGIDWADGERRALKVCISSGGVPSAYYTAASPDNEEPLYIQVTLTNSITTKTSGIGLLPFFSFMTSGTDGPGTVSVQWVQLESAP